MPLNKKTSQLIKNLNGLNKKQLKFVIGLLDADTMEFFRELFLNLNFNTLKINNSQSKKLFNQMRKNQQACEAIADPRISAKRRRSHLRKQAGTGIVTLALSVLGPIVAGLISDAISK